MAECKDCNKSILNGQKSLIADPLCNTDCPTQVVCTGISTYSDCVSVNTALSCVGTDANVSLTTVLTALDAALCENQSSGCTVKISSTDNCCGTLQGKLLAGDGIAITKNTSGSCETLTVSETCYTWTNFNPSSSTGTGNFRNGWTNFVSGGGFTPQTAQYSSVKECTVRLRGIVLINSFTNSKFLIAVLPVGRRPLFTRLFTVNVEAITTNYLAFLSISSNGNIEVLGLPAISRDVSLYLSFDSVFFELN